MRSCDPTAMHAVVTDTKGNLFQFMEYLHKYVAKTINASLGRWENFWPRKNPALLPYKM
ncbi:MAG: hypothetical protein QNJ97_22985 [Myxococcota bacterium]|nr:hypothetical protein [Myxococcota bacterium]